jgi:hypothetical protein
LLLIFFIILSSAYTIHCIVTGKVYSKGNAIRKDDHPVFYWASIAITGGCSVLLMLAAVFGRK